MVHKRAFMVGLCLRKSRQVWLVQRPQAPFGPFALCGVVSER